MENLKLTEANFERVAGLLGVEKAVIKAVQAVETGGLGGFWGPDKPRILFEGHIFWKQLVKLGLDPNNYVEGNEDILYKVWTKAHYRGNQTEYKRLEKALLINREAALASASWGMFQIMGFNYALCGFRGVVDFVEAMKKNEGAQLEAFANFVKGNKLTVYLVNKDWRGFARRYNGPCFEQNKYDQKLEQAYRKYVL